MTEFSLQQINRTEVQILSLSGYMGNDEYGRVDRELAHLLEQGHCRVILDLARLSFATSMSLSRLRVWARKFRRHGGEMKLAGLSPFQNRLARLAGFGRKKHLAADVATALNVRGRPAGAKSSLPPNRKG